jgi:hypothetical protein
VFRKRIKSLWVLAKPLTSRQTVVELIASTATRAGLKVRCELDTRS